MEGVLVIFSPSQAELEKHADMYTKMHFATKTRLTVGAFEGEASAAVLFPKQSVDSILGKLNAVKLIEQISVNAIQHIVFVGTDVHSCIGGILRYAQLYDVLIHNHAASNSSLDLYLRLFAHAPIDIRA